MIKITHQRIVEIKKMQEDYKTLTPKQKILLLESAISSTKHPTNSVKLVKKWR